MTIMSVTGLVTASADFDFCFLLLPGQPAAVSDRRSQLPAPGPGQRTSVFVCLLTYRPRAVSCDGDSVTVIACVLVTVE